MIKNTLVMIVIVMLMAACAAPSPSPSPSPYPIPSDALSSNGELYNKNHITIVGEGMYSTMVNSKICSALRMTITNNSEGRIEIYSADCAVNGKKVDAILYTEIYPGRTVDKMLYLPGVAGERINAMEFTLRIKDRERFQDIATTDLIKVTQ